MFIYNEGTGLSRGHFLCLFEEWNSLYITFGEPRNKLNFPVLLNMSYYQLENIMLADSFNLSTNRIAFVAVRPIRFIFYFIRGITTQIFL